jgi:hypothetical protein
LFVVTFRASVAITEQAEDSAPTFGNLQRRQLATHAHAWVELFSHSRIRTSLLQEPAVQELAWEHNMAHSTMADSMLSFGFQSSQI